MTLYPDHEIRYRQDRLKGDARGGGFAFPDGRISRKVGTVAGLIRRLLPGGEGQDPQDDDRDPHDPEYGGVR